MTVRPKNGPAPPEARSAGGSYLAAMPPPPRGHSHDATEIYVILSGEGDVLIEGNSTPVREGSAVWIPEGLEHYAHNTGSVPLRLLYMFARDKFSDVTYSFPGEN